MFMHIPPPDNPKDFSFTNYEGYTYVTKTGQLDQFYHTPLLLTNRRNDDNPMIYVKWHSDPKLMISFQQTALLVGDKAYKCMYPLELQVRKKKSLLDYDGSWGRIVDGVVYSKLRFEGAKNISELKIVKTPWYMIREYDAKLDYKSALPKQLVWVLSGNGYSMDCIDCDESSSAKLGNYSINHIYSLEQEERNRPTPNNRDLVDLTCLRINARRTADLVLDYLVDKHILFSMADIPCLKPFMNELHFNVWTKTQCFVEQTESENHMFPQYIYAHQLVQPPPLQDGIAKHVIIEAIKSWIAGNCDDAILNLLPILIKRGYVSECASAICQSEDAKAVNIKLGKFMKFDKSHVHEHITLFGQYTKNNPIKYHLARDNVGRAVAFITYHELYSVRCFDRLIETGSQPLIRWMFESGKYDDHILEYKRLIIYNFTSAHNIKLYLKKLKSTINGIGNYGFKELLKHLIRNVTRVEFRDVLSVLSDYKADKINEMLPGLLENTLLELTTSSFGEWNPAMSAQFDRIYQEYECKSGVLYRIEDDLPKGMIITLSYKIDRYEKALSELVKKYDLLDMMDVLDYTDNARTMTNVRSVRRWIDNFKW